MKLLNSKLYRLVNVAGIAAIGHLLSVILIPYTSKYFGNEVALEIAIIDSTFLLISAILAFGLSLTVTRDVSLVEEWEKKVSECLSARISLAILLQLISIILFACELLDEIVFICFLLAPLIAINLDFVLYGRDMPIKAAYASFIRMSVPVIAFIVAHQIFKVDIKYLLLLAISYFLSSLFVFKSLQFFPRKSIKLTSIYLYKSVAFVGVASLFISFQRIGFLSFLDVNQDDMTYLSIMLKFYLAFVAIRRLFIQTFYTNLLNVKIYKKVEVFCFLAAIFGAFVCLVYSEYLALLLFDNSSSYNLEFLVNFAALLLAGSMFSTADARLFLLNKDRYYYISAFVSFFTWSCFAILFVTFDFKSSSILLMLAVSEAALAMCYKYFLVKT